MARRRWQQGTVYLRRSKTLPDAWWGRYVETVQPENGDAMRVHRNVFLGEAGSKGGQLTKPLHYRDVKAWGLIQWARPILDVVFDGSADAVDSQLSRLIAGRYVRLQTRLTQASDDLDDASRENLAALRREAEQLIAARSADLDRLVVSLTRS